ncbi:GNAT family N-acetyltransferase [Amycolatopsis sp. NBC_01488]|uniref:GNAT family N-acetyltransferase n=1 Tax=Amycolatopsis sp. NBC_01488 TaxID=2903563 RepID=UPI002E2B5F18|nr:GNAT family N-acetyltransferase [Amycolatopsis sp. NBC_01488]
MPSKIELLWPTRADAQLRAEVHRVLHDVAASGGAIGYLSPPTSAEVVAWLDEVLDAGRAGTAALAVALVDRRVGAIGLWRRRLDAVFAHSADIEKVMAHPQARGLGLGSLIVTALIDSARKAGIETLALGVRGNNHGAIELYEQLGFREWGRQPNVIEVGNDRYDDVRMSLDLGRGQNVVLRGSECGGPGSSPRR